MNRSVDAISRREALKDRLRNIGSLLSLVILLGLTAWVAWRSLQAPEKEQPPELKGMLVRMTDAGFQVFAEREGKHELVAQVQAKTLSVSQDRNIIVIENAKRVTIFRNGKKYLEGEARRARYDRITKRLTVLDEITLSTIDGEISFTTRGASYFGESEQLVCDQPVTARFRGGVLKTATMSVNVRDELVECRNKVTFQRPEGGRIVADGALANMKEKIITLSGNVQINMTVKEIAETMRPEKKPKEDRWAKTRLRLSTREVVYETDTKDILCPFPVHVTTREAVVRSERARVVGNVVYMEGNVRAELRMREDEEPLKMRTKLVEYNVDTGYFTAPGGVDIETEAGKFHAARAKANPTEGRVSLEGGVSGSFYLES